MDDGNTVIIKTNILRSDKDDEWYMYGFAMSKNVWDLVKLDLEGTSPSFQSLRKSQNHQQRKLKASRSFQDEYVAQEGGTTSDYEETRQRTALPRHFQSLEGTRLSNGAGEKESSKGQMEVAL
ncbi:hypothetical protein TEQG_08633 [Trichophyton equinum CBS 127.97]|uniref:Uncharacterized protein n=1 Tax=Trichophyton equinum (strain ATCC MYA-4606 / CBS 127.97) TaxID=559882 RepID=F2PNI3_TRIEC|nr:hypothetical protein TEQG_08633 [Trichophyton equinum CBS 127.97]